MHVNVIHRQNFLVLLQHDFFHEGVCLMPLNLAGHEQVHDTHYFEVQMHQPLFAPEILLRLATALYFL